MPQTVNDIIDRLKEAAHVSTDAALAESLGLSRQSIAAARMRGKVPSSWIIKGAEKFNVSADWLSGGDDKPGPQKVVNDSIGEPQIPPWETLFAENRQLSLEVRVLHQEKEALLLEIANLREKVTRLEAQAEFAGNTPDADESAQSVHMTAPFSKPLSK